MAADYLTFVKDPRLADTLAGVHQRASHFVSVAGPRLSRAAQDTAKAVTEHSLAARDEIAKTLRKEGPAAVAAIRAATKSARTPGFSIVRFAARRPVVLILGGVAVAGLGIALGRWLTSREKDLPDADGRSTDEIGEGSYEGTRDYQERTRHFLDAHGDEVPDLAQKASDALEGAEGPGLAEAERRGKAHARS